MVGVRAAAASPVVPLSQALAELAATSAVLPATVAEDLPRVALTSAIESTSVIESASAPVGLSISAMFDEALRTEVAPTEAIAPTSAIQPITPACLPEPSEPSVPQAAEVATLPSNLPSAVFGAADLAEPNVAAPYFETPGLRDTFAATTVTVRSLPPADVAAAAPAAIDVIAATRAPLPDMPAQTVTISPPPAEPAWQPLLQVDRVVWPSIHDRLQSTAAVAIDQLSSSLLSICESGSKILGLGSCTSGEGVTTLLLAAARKLLSQGRKVVLVDANWNSPHLAQSLGLLPQIGWEETLCSGLPLEEVVIESLDDGLAVLPLIEPPAITIERAAIAASLEILAREFDIVLVDLGALGNDEDDDASSREGTPSRQVAAQMDAVILVQNVRATTPNRLAEARERLAATNVRHAGTIQNFVAG
jgi:Mrp family chromosome partitioning ATPase